MNMRRKTKKMNAYGALGFLSLLLVMGSCKEFLEEDISERQISLTSPGKEAVLSTYTVTFRWEEMEDALSYRLQIATPGFDSLDYIVEDTLVSDLKYTLSLQPGRYQWRVRGVNGSSQSGYTTQSFLIYESDLSKQTVVQESPADQFITTTNRLSLGWQSLFGVQAYRVQVDTNRFSDEETLVYNELIGGTSIVFQIPKEQGYQWRVRAESDTSQSGWSATRSFTFDRTPPAVPVMREPANNSAVSSPVTLRWDAVPDAESYQVYVYKSDSVTLYNSSYPLTIKESSHAFKSGTPGERVVWRVKAVDQAGNASAFSGYRSFNLNVVP